MERLTGLTSLLMKVGSIVQICAAVPVRTHCVVCACTGGPLILTPTLHENHTYSVGTQARTTISFQQVKPDAFSQHGLASLALLPELQSLVSLD